MSENDQKLLAEINQKMDKLVGLFAIQGKTENQQIAILRGMGFDWNFIGAVTGMKSVTARKRFERRSDN